VGNLLAVLPMALVMVAGPQIVSAIFLATSGEPRRNSLAFLAGVAIATITGVTLVYWAVGAFQGSGNERGGGRGDAIDYAIIALLLFLMVRVYLKRNDTEPPKWMGRLQSATPGFAFKLGFMLFILMPTDIITMLTVGSYLARHDAPWWHALPFIFLTLLLVGLPLLMLVLLGRKAETLLPKMRAWMNTNSWVVNEVVIVFFLVMTISGLS
jgi:threonine/homoserine/homoserine lactone efflux protein